MNIVLFNAEIPQNTGAIGRTAKASNSRLHLIHPLGFKLDNKNLKRAGMDYWHELGVQEYDDFDDFKKKNNNPKIYMATTKAKKIYTQVEYEKDAFIMFGSESKGIPEEILVDYQESAIRIPMLENERSLNLSISVAIVLFEAYRQNNFFNLQPEGNLHKLEWK